MCFHNSYLETCGGVDVKLHSLSSVVNVGERLASYVASCIHGEIILYRNVTEGWDSPRDAVVLAAKRET
jgi:hypothetical protein